MPRRSVASALAADGAREGGAVTRRQMAAALATYAAMDAAGKGARAENAADADEEDEDEDAAVARMNKVLDMGYDAAEGYTDLSFDAEDGTRVGFAVPARWEARGTPVENATGAVYPGWKDPVTGASADGAQVSVTALDRKVTSIDELGSIDRFNVARDLGLDKDLLRRGDVFAARTRNAPESEGGVLWYEWDLALAPTGRGVQADPMAIMEQGEVVLVGASVDARTHTVVAMLVRADRAEWASAENALRAMRRSFGPREPVPEPQDGESS